MPPPPDCSLPVHQHWHICLPEAPLHVLLLPESFASSSVLSGASSSEPPHLQPEEPGAEGCSLESDVWVFLRKNKMYIFCISLIIQLFTDQDIIVLFCFPFLFTLLY